MQLADTFDEEGADQVTSIHVAIHAFQYQQDLPLERIPLNRKLIRCRAIGAERPPDMLIDIGDNAIRICARKHHRLPQKKCDAFMKVKERGTVHEFMLLTDESGVIDMTFSVAHHDLAKPFPVLAFIEVTEGLTRSDEIWYAFRPEVAIYGALSKISMHEINEAADGNVRERQLKDLHKIIRRTSDSVTNHGLGAIIPYDAGAAGYDTDSVRLVAERVRMSDLIVRIEDEIIKDPDAKFRFDSDLELMGDEEMEMSETCLEDNEQSNPEDGPQCGPPDRLVPNSLRHQKSIGVKIKNGVVMVYTKVKVFIINAFRGLGKFLAGLLHHLKVSFKKMVQAVRRFFSWTDIKHTQQMFRITMQNMVRLSASSIGELQNAAVSKLDGLIDRLEGWKNTLKHDQPDILQDSADNSATPKRVDQYANFLTRKSLRSIDGHDDPVMKVTQEQEDMVDDIVAEWDKSGADQEAFQSEQPGREMARSLKSKMKDLFKKGAQLMLSSLASLLIQCVKVFRWAVSKVLKLVVSLVKGLDRALAKPIRVPLLSKLMEKHFGFPEVSMYDVFALVFGMAYTIMYKVTHFGRAPYSHEDVKRFRQEAEAHESKLHDVSKKVIRFRFDNLEEQPVLVKRDANVRHNGPSPFNDYNAEERRRDQKRRLRHRLTDATGYLVLDPIARMQEDLRQQVVAVRMGQSQSYEESIAPIVETIKSFKSVINLPGSNFFLKILGIDNESIKQHANNFAKVASQDQAVQELTATARNGVNKPAQLLGSFAFLTKLMFSMLHFGERMYKLVVWYSLESRQLVPQLVSIFAILLSDIGWTIALKPVKMYQVDANNVIDGKSPVGVAKDEMQKKLPGKTLIGNSLIIAGRTVAFLADCIVHHLQLRMFKDMNLSGHAYQGVYVMKAFEITMSTLGFLNLLRPLSRIFPVLRASEAVTIAKNVLTGLTFGIGMASIYMVAIAGNELQKYIWEYAVTQHAESNASLTLDVAIQELRQTHNDVMANSKLCEAADYVYIKRQIVLHRYRHSEAAKQLIRVVQELRKKCIAARQGIEIS